MTSLVASAGLFTGGLEAVATSIGAGILVGSFAFGVRGLATGTPKEVSEGKAVTGGYVGGTTALFLLVIDILRKYVV
jgi:hypothetical protein